MPPGTLGSGGVQREVTPRRSPGDEARAWLQDLGPCGLSRDQPPSRRPRCRHHPGAGHTKPMPRGRVAQAGREDARQEGRCPLWDLDVLLDGMRL